MDNQPLGEWQIAQVPKAMAIKAQFRVVSIDGHSLKSDAGRQRRVSFQPIYGCLLLALSRQGVDANRGEIFGSSYIHMNSN